MSRLGVTGVRELRDLGGYLREQRQHAQLSVRQLSKAAGISHPYLSQIERGLRRPSAEILQALAKGVEISAESLYVQAGLLDVPETPVAGDEGSGGAPDVPLRFRLQMPLLGSRRGSDGSCSTPSTRSSARRTRSARTTRSNPSRSSGHQRRSRRGLATTPPIRP